MSEDHVDDFNLKYINEHVYDELIGLEQSMNVEFYPSGSYEDEEVLEM